jgi:DNA integrity scanning protein DisA with diadenylate cyclase activity
MTDQEISNELAEIRVNARKLQTQIDDLAADVEQECASINPDVIEDEDKHETAKFRKGVLSDLQDNLTEISDALDDLNFNDGVETYSWCVILHARYKDRISNQREK